MPGRDGFSDRPQRKIVVIDGIDGRSKVAEPQQDDRPAQPAVADEEIGTLSANASARESAGCPLDCKPFQCLQRVEAV